MPEYKRPKEIESKTEAIKLESCGTMHLTIGYQEEVEGKVVEIRCSIGKAGVPCNILLDSFSKAMSMLLQSPMPRYKIIEKIKRQFKGVVCGNQSRSCIDVVAEKLLAELV